jgi:protein SCO1/2
VAFWRLLSAAFCLLILFATNLAGADFRSGALSPPQKAPDFALKASNGSEFRLSRYRGKIVILSFGYTYCPDVCPTTLANLASLRKKLGGGAERVQVAYVTVDPGRDTPERLRAYTSVFDKTFLGLTGTAEQLAAVKKAYNVSSQKEIADKSSGFYLIHHSASVYFIDGAGYLRVIAPFGTPLEDMIHDAKILLEKSR